LEILFIAKYIILQTRVKTFIFVESNLRPTIISLAETRAKVLATEAINNIYE